MPRSSTAGGLSSLFAQARCAPAAWLLLHISNMGLFDFFKPKKTQTVLYAMYEAMQEDPDFKEQKASFVKMSKETCKDGCETDEIPGGHGEFGYQPTNPIPTNTVYGATSYLMRLRYPDRARLIFKRRDPVTSPVSQHLIDPYQIVHPDGRLLATVYLSQYQKKDSHKCPRGFSLNESTFGSVANCFMQITAPKLIAAGEGPFVAKMTRLWKLAQAHPDAANHPGVVDSLDHFVRSCI